MSQLDKNLGQKTVVPLLKDDEFSPEFMVMVRRLKEAKSSKINRINNSARAMAHADEFGMATRNYLQSTWDLGDLSKPFKALIRFKVATTNTCFYCSTHQIEHLRRLGCDENIQSYSTDDSFTASEKAALAFVDHMMTDASNIPDNVVEDFQEHYSPKERIEIALTATAMSVLNKFNDAFRIPIEDEVIGIGIDVPKL
jgi:alkylhydroperoxidase family enzyme